MSFKKKLILFVLFGFGKNLLAPNLRVKNCTKVDLNFFLEDFDKRTWHSIGVDQELVLEGVGEEPGIIIKEGEKKVAYTKVDLSRDKYLKICVAKAIAPDSAGNAKECGDWFSTACTDYTVD